MKNITTLRAVCMCVLVGLFGFQGIGQSTPQMEENAQLEQLKAAKKEIRENTRAFKAEKHSEMDSKFSSSDLRIVKGLRVKAKSIREQQKSEMKALRAESKQEGVDRMELRGKMLSMKSRHHDQMTTIHKDLKPVMERNEEMLREIGTSMKAYAKEQRAIATEEFGNLKGKAKSGKDAASCEGKAGKKCAKKGRKGKKGKRGGAKAEGKKQGGAMKMARFVLWDGEQKEKRAERSLKRRSQKQPELNNSGLRNFPNPASSSTSVEFELPKNADFVTLQIADFNGNMVRKVNYGQMTEGKHTVDVQIKDLPAGTYTYTITTDNHQETKKMSIAR